MASMRITAMLENVTRKWKRIEQNVAITTTGDNVDWRTILVTSGAEVTHTIDTAIGNAGLIFIYNHDSTNFIKIGFATTVYPIECHAGECQVFRLEPTETALFLRADTADCTADSIITEA